MSENLKPFESSVEFNQSQIELMITEIGEAIEALHRRGVFRDFPKAHEIDLLHKEDARLQFERSERLELKRFMSLFKSSARALTYLVNNPMWETIQRSVPRNDRVMGAISYPETLKVKETGGTEVVCLEIHRNWNTSANRLLCNTLLATALFCNRYLQSKGALLSDPDQTLDDPIMGDIGETSILVSQLLKSRFVQEVLRSSVCSIEEVDRDLAGLKSQAMENRLQTTYLSLIQFFQRWKYYVWVARTEDHVQRSLRYHFFHMNDFNRLYESWVCFKILRYIADSFDIRMIERRSSSGIKFSDAGRELNVIYQRRYATRWKDEEGNVRVAIPDIFVEQSGKARLVIDAKNSQYTERAEDTYRKDVAEYLDVTGAKRGLVAHSVGPTSEILWRTMSSDTGEEISWTSLTPGNKDVNRDVLDHIMKLID